MRIASVVLILGLATVASAERVAPKPPPKQVTCADIKKREADVKKREDAVAKREADVKSREDAFRAQQKAEIERLKKQNADLSRDLK